MNRVDGVRRRTLSSTQVAALEALEATPLATLQHLRRLRPVPVGVTAEQEACVEALRDEVRRLLGTPLERFAVVDIV